MVCGYAWVMTHLERLLAELRQISPLEEWGIDKLHVYELIQLAKELDRAVEKLKNERKNK